MGLQQVLVQVVKSFLQPKYQSDYIDMSHFENIHYPYPTEVISNGVTNTTNLEKLNLDEQWLDQQLKQLGIHSVSDVIHAEVQQDGSLFINECKNLLH
ncbi:Protein of unknown function [Mesobacillus persicus]|uniref:YetF C-terminal domain-containing protein n=1 Tax=Mesobacillus persicus TaxID=930146 RepID=A0A1H7VMC7_9BACI|nr:YetF domain-containing protein [Mesobacillus persicus]SEM10393.1 Protein of unknown function [Mesobacillus persicus]